MKNLYSFIVCVIELVNLVFFESEATLRDK